MLKVRIRRGISDQTSREINLPIIYRHTGSLKDKFISIKGYVMRAKITNQNCYRPPENSTRDAMYVCYNRRKNLNILADVEYEIELKGTKMEAAPVQIDIFKIASVKKYNNKLVNTSRTELLELAKDQLKDLVLIPGFNYILDHNKSGTKIDVCLSLNKPTYYNGGDFKITEIEISKGAAKKIIISDSYLQDLSIFKNDFNLQKLGIGGLKKECQELFRRAFCSRTCHPDLIKEININHCKGVILYGPPGTGKTLIARQLAKIMNSHPPKIINGPEILNKYVGESEANLRSLFIDAEMEYKEKKEFSQLHVVIFDEFDCIARKRSSDSNGNQVASNLVNQLLSKMDGVESLNNILVIGLTNRIDLIDKALLRPGRFEVSIEIGIPEAADRLEILQIHLQKLMEKKLLDHCGITIEELVSSTENFTGAEIAGLVRNVTSYAIERAVSQNHDEKEPLQDWTTLKIERDDFSQSIKSINQTKSHRGKLLDLLVPDMSPEWGSQVQPQLEELKSKIHTYFNDENNEYYGQSFKILIIGGKRAGKSTLAADIARETKISNIIYTSNFDLLGKLDHQKALFLKEMFQDSTTPQESIMIFDDIDQMIELSFKDFHIIYSNTLLQTFRTLFSTPVPNKVVYIATSSSNEQIKQVDLRKVFHQVIEIPVESS